MTTRTSTACAAGVLPRMIHAGVFSVSAQYTLSGSLSAGDVIQMVKIPDGATVLDTILKTTLSPTSVVLSLGDGGDVARYILTASHSSQVSHATAGVPYTYDISDAATVRYDTIDVNVTAASGSGNSTFDLTVICTMDK